MLWRDQTRLCRIYFLTVYLCAVPAIFLCFSASNELSYQWLLFAIISAFVSTVSVRLPQLSAIISMGDVFIIVVLMRFGPGAALITYWLDIAVATIANVVKKQGIHLKGKIHAQRWLFNMACCALSTWTMHLLYSRAAYSSLPYPINLLLALAGIAVGWFVVNTGTLSLALAFWMKRRFLDIWREGLLLYLLNFMGSAAAAGLIFVFYDRAGFLVFVLAVPIAVILYQLYSFYIDKYEQAQRHIGDLSKLYLQTIEALASAVDAKDRYTHGHIRRVQAYAVKLATLLGITAEKELMAIQAGALLHDIGKIAIPEYILNKPDALTAAEYERMKTHPTIGANILGGIDFPYPLIPMVKWHHERWDGKGYPDGLAGENIPLNARILSLVDCYDALTTLRPYRTPINKQQVIQFFERESGHAYDPALVAVFLAHLDDIEVAGADVITRPQDLWGPPSSHRTSSPPVDISTPARSAATYANAINLSPEILGEFSTLMEFVRADFLHLPITEWLEFVGRRLQRLVSFDAAVFYLADLANGVLTARYVTGSAAKGLEGITINLEQKLTGWVAANNQPLCNLSPISDFINYPKMAQVFSMSAIAPMNAHSRIIGAISLYRSESSTFTDQDFRLLEMIASQTAKLIARCDDQRKSRVSVDKITSLADSAQIELIFDLLAPNAIRYRYQIAILYVRVDCFTCQKRFIEEPYHGDLERQAAEYLKRYIRDGDLLVHHADNGFVVIGEKMSDAEAACVSTQIQADLNNSDHEVHEREHVLWLSVGAAAFPNDGSTFTTLLKVAQDRLDTPFAVDSSCLLVANPELHSKH